MVMKLTEKRSLYRHGSSVDRAKRKCKTQFYLKILTKKLKVNGERSTEVLHTCVNVYKRSF